MDASSDRPKRPGQREHGPPSNAPPSKACPLRRPSDCPEWPTSPQPAAPTDEPRRPTDEPRRLPDEPRRPPDEPRRPTDEPRRPPDEPRRRCLPAALLLGARGCGAPAFGHRLLSHPGIARVPRGMSPWWTYPSLENFTEHPGMRSAVAGIVARDGGARDDARHDARHGASSAPATALLLVQQSTLDARSAGWGRVLRAKGVELFDLLPRVQASLVNCLG